MITYHFSPSRHIGAKRPIKLCKFLPQCGWQPIILTTGERYYALDETLNENLPIDLQVYRVREWHLYREKKIPIEVIPPTVSGSSLGGSLNPLISKALSYLLWYDYSWMLPALIQGMRILQRHKIDLLFSTSPNPETHMVALFLKLFSRKRWVCEFRDPWTLQPGYAPPFLQLLVDRYMERLVLRYADHVIAVSEMLKADLVRLSVGTCQSKITVIYNGYDGDDFVGFSSSPKRNEEKFTITYLGTWGREITPEPFLWALGRLLTNQPELRRKIRVDFIGEVKWDPDLAARIDVMIRKQNLGDVICQVPFLPHKQGLLRLKNSDVLLLVVGPNAESRYRVPAKTFEYIFAGRPILGIVQPDGESARIVRETCAGEIVPPDEIEAIEKKIHEMYRLFQRGQLRISPNMAEVEKYDRKRQTATLAQIFDALTDSA